MVDSGTLEQGFLLSQSQSGQDPEKALAIAKRKRNKVLEMWTLAYMAQEHRQVGDFPRFYSETAAAAVVRQQLVSASQHKPFGFWGMSCQMALALTAVVCGKTQEARDSLEFFSKCKGRFMPIGSRGKSSDGILGLLSATVDRLDEAVVHFEDAIVFCKRGYWPELAWTYYDYARTLLRRDSMGDQKRAEGLLREGRSLARQLEMRPLLARIEQSLSGGKPASALTPKKPPFGLTDREVEVLRLVTGGFTNIEIGERLFISPHIVSRHIHNILEKTGMANRAEVAAFAIREGMVE